jgi:hypothetical protein
VTAAEGGDSLSAVHAANHSPFSPDRAGAAPLKLLVMYDDPVIAGGNGACAE